MMYDTGTPWVSNGALTGAQLSDVTATAPKPIPGDAVVRECAPYGLNSDLVLAQMLLETGNGTSRFWTERNNPGGIGAVDTHPDAAYWFNTPADGIHAHIAHLLTYLMGEKNPLKGDDPRFAVVRKDAPVRVVGDMGNGIWATDPGYAAKIVRIANDLLARYTTDTGGNAASTPAPTPATAGGSMVPDQSYSLPVRLDLANNAHSFPDRPTNPDGRILAIVKHVTDGENLDGALSWNRNPAVKAAAHFYIDKDGTVVQDVSLFNGAWANGVLQNDTLPAQFDDVKRNGWYVNDFTIAIEHVGKPFDSDFPTDAERTADARLTADLCDYFSIPVDTEHIIGHNRFDAVNRPNCPGPHWDFAADVRAVSQLLNGGQNAGSTQPVPQPSVDGSIAGNPPTPGGGAGNPRPDGGNAPVAGNAVGGGKQPAGVATNGTLGRTLRHIGVADYYAFVASGDGRGVTVAYPGNPAGIRIGHGFFDLYTGHAADTGHAAADGVPGGGDGLDNGYERFGVPRCSEFAAAIPGVSDTPVTVQVFDNAVMWWRAGMDRPSLLAIGLLAARYMRSVGVPLPFDFHW